MDNESMARTLMKTGLLVRPRGGTARWKLGCIDHLPAAPSASVAVRRLVAPPDERDTVALVAASDIEEVRSTAALERLLAMQSAGELTSRQFHNLVHRSTALVEEMRDQAKRGRRFPADPILKSAILLLLATAAAGSATVHLKRQAFERGVQAELREQARVLRDQMRHIHEDFTATPPKNANDAARRIGQWSSCDDAGAKDGHAYSRFEWRYQGPSKSSASVIVEVDKDATSGCDPNSVIRNWSVAGHDVDDETIDRLYR
jgi:hypothetical protein